MRMKMILTAGLEEINLTTQATNSEYKTRLLLFIILGMVITLAILIPILVIHDKKSKRSWKTKGNSIIKRKLSDQILGRLYLFFKNFPLTRRHVDKLGYRYRYISPCDSRIIARKTVIACIFSWLLCLITFFFVFILDPKMINLITAAVAVILIDAEVVGNITASFEINTNKDIQVLISNMIHYFYVQYRVDDALYRSLEKLSPNMKKAAEQIYNLLLSEEKEDALREYYDNVPNKYLRAFVNQCVGVMERGDQTIDGKRLFVRNLENLHREIDIEVEKLEKLRIDFMGVMLCVLAPVFCIDFMKKFAINIKENMSAFFYGKEGFLYDIGLLVLIAGIYYIMRKSAEYKTYYQAKHRFLYQVDKITFVKKAMDNYCDKYASRVEALKRELRNNGNNIRPRQFILRSFLLSGAVFLISVSICGYLHLLTKEQLLVANRADVELLTSAAKENHYEEMGRLIAEYTKRYTVKSEKEVSRENITSEDDLSEILQKEGSFSSPLINKALANDILRRVKAYQKEYFSAREFAICTMISILAYYIPFSLLRYNSTISKEAMEDEVNQFNALICMNMYVDGMTVKQILMELESFAVVFKQSIRVCINDFGAGDLDALNKLSETEPYEPFRRIVDNFIRCDDMPIYQAFHEVNVEADGYITKRKLANEKSRKKRVFRAYILAAVPFIALFAYGLVPTLLSSLQEINMIIEELESTSW